MSNKYLFLALYQKLKTKRIMGTWKNCQAIKQVLKQQEPFTLICSNVRELRLVLLPKECQIHKFHPFGDTVCIFKRKKFKWACTLSKSPLVTHTSLRSWRLEVVGERENGRARGRHAYLLLARPFFLAPTTSKRLLLRLHSYALARWNSKLKSMHQRAG